MSCPHSASDVPCPRCAETRGVDRSAAPTLEDLDGHTLLRQGRQDTAAPEWEVGARLGRYVILEVLGLGGMGVVYAAYDPVLDRRVAIKVLRTPRGKGSRGSSEGRSRLLREAQAMAQLAHPNVVPVYDVGTEGQSVFVAMELVKGVTLNTWALAKPRAWQEVLGALVGAGRGLEAAHAAGLVHRDFKPANVLMGEDGRPRVTDFGLARSTRSASRDDAPVSTDGSGDSVSLETPLTQVGMVMGSPGYMAPEQYDGADTSAATDQYAFCVTLYELLYGQRPFVSDDFVTLARLARGAAVPPPPKGSTVPAWIYPVLVKGLAAEPSQRHASMTALLAELSKDPARTRRRALAVLATVLLVAGAGLGWRWQSQRMVRECRASADRLTEVWNDAARTRAEAAFDGTGRSFARVAWEHARAAMDTWASAWVAARIDACEATRVRAEQSEAQLALRLSCLDQRLEEFRTLATGFAHADGEMIGVASEAVARLTPLVGCENLRALEDRARLAPEAQQSVARLEQQLSHGRALLALGRLAEARAEVEPAVSSAEALAVPAFRGEALVVLGELELEANRFAEARTAYQRAVEQALAAGDDATAARALAALVSVVGWRLEQPAEGLMVAAFARGVLGRMGGDRALSVALDEGTGDALWQAGDRDAALASYRRALDGAIALHGPQSNIVARLRSSVGWVLMEQGHLEEARREYEASRTIRERNLGEGHPSLAQTWNELGSLASQRGEYERSIEAYARSKAIYEQALGARAFRVARALLNQAEDQVAFGRFEDAERALADVSARLHEDSEAPPSWRMQWERVAAQAHSARGKHAEALAEAGRAVQLAEQHLGPEHPETAGCVLVLGRVQVRAGRFADAAATLQRYLALSDKLKLAQGRDSVDGLLRLAAARRALGQPGLALAHLEEAARQLEAVEGNELLRAEVRLALAEALWDAPAQRPRAHALGQQAYDGFHALGHAEGAERAHAWLARHP